MIEDRVEEVVEVEYVALFYWSSTRGEDGSDMETGRIACHVAPFLQPWVK